MAEKNNAPQRLLPLGQQPLGTVPVSKSEAPSLDAKVDAWLDENPATQEFKAADEAAPRAEAPPAEPIAETVPKVKSEAEALTDATQQPSTETVDKPSTEAVAKVPPTEAPEQPKAEVPPTVEAPPPVAEVKPAAIDLNAKYTLVEGAPAWSGEQILQRLREFQPLEAKAHEAETYREVFGMDGEQAKVAWAPIIKSLRETPANVELFAKVIDDPERAAYLRDCNSYYDSPEAQAVRAQAAAAQPQAAPIHPDVQRRLDEMQAQLAAQARVEESRKKQFFTDRVAREMNQVFAAYPFLRSNPELANDLLMTANALNGGDDSENSKGIFDALALKKPLYDAMLIASNHSLETPPAMPAPPALLGSQGAAPQATRNTSVKPKKFTSLDDAVDDWVSSPPSQYR